MEMQKLCKDSCVSHPERESEKARFLFCMKAVENHQEFPVAAACLFAYSERETAGVAACLYHILYIEPVNNRFGCVLLYNYITFATS